MLRHILKPVSIPEKNRFLVSLLAGGLLYMVFILFTFNGKITVWMMVKTQSATSIVLSANNQQGEEPGISDSIMAILEPANYQTVRLSLPRNWNRSNIVNLILNSNDGQVVELRYLLIKKRGFYPYDLKMSFLREGESVSKVQSGNTMLLKVGQGSGCLEFEFPPSDFKLDWILLLFYGALSALLSFVVYFSSLIFRFRKISHSTLIIALGFFVVSGLILTMALKAGYNASPDEHDHFMAAEYYKSHSLTPAPFSEKAVHAYNFMLNYSRVYQLGIHYFLAGKWSNLFDWILPSYVSVRLLGILLWLLFIGLALRFHRYSLILLPLLLSPQVWYLFSYVNDESLALFLSFLLILLTESSKEILLLPGWKKKKLMLLLLIGLILGLVTLSKRNFWAFSLFYLFYLVVLPLDFQQGICSLFRQARKGLSLIMPVMFTTLLAIGFRMLTVEWQSESSLSPETAVLYEQMKLNLDQYFASCVSGKDRFGSLTSMLVGWLPVNFQSMFGVYGFMKYYGSTFYYSIVLMILLLLLTLFLKVALRKGNLEIRFWGIVAMGSVLAIVLISAYFYSYVIDYQAQGRFAFVVLPIIGLSLYKIRGKYSLNKVFLLFIALFLLSVYSFIFIGINSL